MHTSSAIHADTLDNATPTPMAPVPPSTSDTQGTILERLAKEINAAIISTQSTDASNKFIPNAELLKVLNHESLTQLFTELCAQRVMVRQNGSSSARSDSVVGHQVPEDLAHKVRAEPSRISLLALFIYDERARCLSLLMDWLLASSQTSFPSDNDLPFGRDQARGVFHYKDVEYVLDYQAMFKPFIIREHEYRTLDLRRSRPPFIGARTKLGEGSSGAVFKVTIAAGHYEYKRNNRYVPENDNYTVAMKVFHETAFVSAESATEDYNVEREFLEQLRKDKKLHKMILLDLGGIVELGGETTLKQSLLFDLALCDLDKFFKSEHYKHQYSEKGWMLIAKAMDLLDALDFLHSNFKSLHLDIKPDNILVFDNPDMEYDTNWKLSDFSLSRKKLVRSPVGSYEFSNIGSNQSTVPSARSAGIYQAPEIQTREISPASEGSDVWSMGCLIITLLAFLRSDGIHQVHKLDELLDVYTSDTRLERRLFYVTNAMLQWHDPPRAAEKLNIRTEKGSIGPNVEVMLHPRLIEWMDYLYISSETDIEQKGLALAANIILGSVLVIDRKKRISAVQFRNRLHEVYEVYESSNTARAQPMTTQHTPVINPPTAHSRLCEAIRHSACATIVELIKTPRLSSSPCPRRKCGEYPLHQVLRNKHLPALDEILVSLTAEDVQQESTVTIQTPLDIACERDGDDRALELLYKHFGNAIDISEDFYHSISPAGKAAKILKEWYKKSKKRQSDRVRSGSATGSPRSSISSKLLPRNWTATP